LQTESRVERVARIRVVEGEVDQAETDAIVTVSTTGLPKGEVTLTDAGELPTGYLIHVAASEPGEEATEESVRSAVRDALRVARERALRSVAFPAIGAGEGGLSLQCCAEIMLSEAGRPCDGDTLEEIRFVLAGEPAYRVFEQVADAERIRIQMEKLRR
jgi:O-acetyl-ADP-ribose deacetylase (regulator of RNase III)